MSARYYTNPANCIVVWAGDGAPLHVLTEDGRDVAGEHTLSYARELARSARAHYARLYPGLYPTAESVPVVVRDAKSFAEVPS